MSIANLFRKKTRTILTILSVIMAFLLFGLLQSLNSIFNAGADFVGATRLMTQARVSFTQPLPLSMVPKLGVRAGRGAGGVLAVVRRGLAGKHPGVHLRGRSRSATTTCTRSGSCRRSNGRLSSTRALRWSPASSWRTSTAGRWARRFRCPRTSIPQKNGSKSWAFDLVGIYDGKDEDWKKQTNAVFINHDYFDEANLFGKGRTNFYILKLAPVPMPAR